MNSIKIEADCGIVTLKFELRSNDVAVAKTQIDMFLTMAENLWEINEPLTELSGGEDD